MRYSTIVEKDDKTLLDIPRSVQAAEGLHREASLQDNTLYHQPMGTTQGERHQRLPEARGGDKRTESRCHNRLQSEAEHDRPRLRDDHSRKRRGSREGSHRARV